MNVPKERMKKRIKKILMTKFNKMKIYDKLHINLLFFQPSDSGAPPAHLPTKLVPLVPLKVFQISSKLLTHVPNSLLC